MNKSTRTWLAGSTAALGLLLSVSACGSQSAVTDPAVQSGGHHPATGVNRVKGHGGVSADAAERQAQADKARHDSASAARYDRDGHQENRLKESGHPGAS